MSNSTNDPEIVLAFHRKSREGSLVAIRHKAQAEGVEITDDRI